MRLKSETFVINSIFQAWKVWHRKTGTHIELNEQFWRTTTFKILNTLMRYMDCDNFCEAGHRRSRL